MVELEKGVEDKWMMWWYKTLGRLEGPKTGWNQPLLAGGTRSSQGQALAAAAGDSAWGKGGLVCCVAAHGGGKKSRWHGGGGVPAVEEGGEKGRGEEREGEACITT